MFKNILKILGLGSALSLAAGPALAEVSPETAYVAFLFLSAVFWSCLWPPALPCSKVAWCGQKCGNHLP